MKKRILVSLIAVSLLFVLAGCTNNTDTYNINGTKVKLDTKENFEEKVYYLSSNDIKEFENYFMNNINFEK